MLYCSSRPIQLLRSTLVMVCAVTFTLCWCAVVYIASTALDLTFHRLVKFHVFKYRLGTVHRDMPTCTLCKTFSGFSVVHRHILLCPASNFKGPVIKEALVVFRVIEKQGSARGFPIRTPRPAVAQLPVYSLDHGSDGIPKGPYRTCQGHALFCS